MGKSSVFLRPVFNRGNNSEVDHKRGTLSRSKGNVTRGTVSCSKANVTRGTNSVV
uniref:Uncharacterized protein n=1 Tax=Anguilla anguilla TaxID=7936 RepID=A0A0E9T3J9_ANGAN